MRKSVILLMTLLFFTFLTACGEDPVQSDLLNYVNNELSKLQKTESDISNKINGVIGTNYKNDEITYETLDKEIIPKYKKFLGQVEGVEPKTPEVKQVHELYIDSVHQEYNALVQLMSAIENNDSNLTVESNEKINLSAKKSREFTSKLTELASKHGIEMKK